MRTLLDHLGLWLIRSRPPRQAHAPPFREYVADDPRHTALPDHAVYGDPDYPSGKPPYKQHIEENAVLSQGLLKSVSKIPTGTPPGRTQLFTCNFFQKHLCQLSQSLGFYSSSLYHIGPLLEFLSDVCGERLRSAAYRRFETERCKFLS
jgi:hypothetical protein